ncbi:DUF3558 domain-containing protein [Streptomyces sp. NPDC001020]
MQRKAYVPGAAMLLAALLTACTSGSGGDSPADGSGSGGSAASAAAEPGKYRTLADACSSVSHGALDSLLPGIKQIADQEQRDKAYGGQAELTYDNDRRSGCRWKTESADASDHLYVDFERVVSYDTTVSDDDRAQQVFADKAKTANITLPSADSSEDSDSGSPSPDASASGSPSATTTPSGSPAAPTSGSPSVTGTSTDLEPRALDDLGDEAFLNDQPGTAQQRTVTVAFRTSNVIVTIEYDEQSAPAKTAPSSQVMQEKAQKLAQRLAGSLG